MLEPMVRQLWRIDTASFQKFTRYYTFIGEPSRERYSLGWGGLDRPDADRTVSRRKFRPRTGLRNTDLLLRWNPGQTDWGQNGTCGNPINTREPSGDRLMHREPIKDRRKNGNPG